MERQPCPPPGSCVAKNSQRPASVETVQGGVSPYGVKETLVVNGKYVLTKVLIKIKVQSCPATTRPVIRGIGCNAVDRASRFFCRQGEYVEIMVNNVTVILVVRYTCKINTTSTNTVPRTVPRNIRSH